MLFYALNQKYSNWLVSYPTLISKPWEFAREFARFCTPWRRVNKVDFGTLKRRAASQIVLISCFLIACTADKSLPSCSVEFLELWDPIGNMVGS